ncbi:MAG: hypothetical protein DRI73_11185 [Bacteroidetes bacterium]|nr:MAG: hypothetical protein DRI73_11185 [Bacteroidota bacterium]
MKKLKTILIIMLFVVSNITYAQRISIGIKDGISRSDIKFEYKDFNDSFYFAADNLKGGRNYGLMLNYQITNFFSIQSELYHSEKGFEFNLCTDLDGGSGIYGSYKMNYITIPLLANFEIGKSFKFYGYAGLYMSFLNSAKNQITIASIAPPDYHHDYSYDPTSELYKKESGALVGLGVKIPLCNKFKLFIDTRYETGLTKAARDDIEYGDYHVIGVFKDVYNRSFSVNWGIFYRFTKQE